MPKRTLRLAVAHLAGVAFWLVLAAGLKASCLVDLPRAIDSLWTERIADHLVKNLLGAIALHAPGDRCDERLFYTARYYPNGMTGEYATQSLRSLVEVDSWQLVGSDHISTTYTDRAHRYVIYRTSDGVSLRVFDR